MSVGNFILWSVARRYVRLRPSTPANSPNSNTTLSRTDAVMSPRLTVLSSGDATSTAKSTSFALLMRESRV